MTDRNSSFKVEFDFKADVMKSLKDAGGLFNDLESDIKSLNDTVKTLTASFNNLSKVTQRCVEYLSRLSGSVRNIGLRMSHTVGDVDKFTASLSRASTVADSSSKMFKALKTAMEGAGTHKENGSGKAGKGYSLADSDIKKMGAYSDALGKLKASLDNLAKADIGKVLGQVSQLNRETSAKPKLNLGSGGRTATSSATPRAGKRGSELPNILSFAGTAGSSPFMRLAAGVVRIGPLVGAIAVTAGAAVKAVAFLRKGMLRAAEMTLRFTAALSRAVVDTGLMLSKLESQVNSLYEGNQGKAGVAYIKDLANSLAITTEEAAGAFMHLTKASNTSDEAARWVTLASRIAAFKEDQNTQTMSSSIQQLIVTGELGKFAVTSGISDSFLQQTGAYEAFRRRDMDAAYHALSKAAEMAGMSARAFEDLRTTAHFKVRQVQAVLKNELGMMTQFFFDGMKPGITNLAQLLQSPEFGRVRDFGRMMFSGLGSAFSHIIDKASQAIKVFLETGDIFSIFGDKAKSVGEFIATFSSILVTVGALKFLPAIVASEMLGLGDGLRGLAKANYGVADSANAAADAVYNAAQHELSTKLTYSEFIMKSANSLREMAKSAASVLVNFAENVISTFAAVGAAVKSVMVGIISTLRGLPWVGDNFDKAYDVIVRPEKEKEELVKGIRNAEFMRTYDAMANKMSFGMGISAADNMAFEDQRSYLGNRTIGEFMKSNWTGGLYEKALAEAGARGMDTSFMSSQVTDKAAMGRMNDFLDEIVSNVIKPVIDPEYHVQSLLSGIRGMEKSLVEAAQNGISTAEEFLLNLPALKEQFGQMGAGIADMRKGVRIKGKVELKSEELRMLADLAERQFITKVNLNVPTANVTTNILGNADKNIVDESNKLTAKNIKRASALMGA